MYTLLTIIIVTLLIFDYKVYKKVSKINNSFYVDTIEKKLMKIYGNNFPLIFAILFGQILISIVICMILILVYLP